MLLVINNSNRNKEVLNYLRKSKRLLGFSKKCNKESKKNNQTRTIHITDKLIEYLKKKKIVYKNIISKKELKKFLSKGSKERIDGIILGGSNLKYSNKLCACSINNNIISLLEFKVPILGICFGFQTIAMSHGGEVLSMNNMVNKKKKVILKKSKLFKNLKNEEHFKFIHNDYVSEIPQSFKIIGKTTNKMIQAIEHKEKPIYGVQFHPEVSGKVGEKLLDNFLDICNL